jgi:succinate dehydrogenase / fumarate reductase membrane anchor subunit
MDMQSPLGRVRGLGSAREGAATWFAERLTALALIPLTVWFVAVMISGLDADYAAMRAWMAGPGNLTLMVLLLGFSFWHMALGLVAVIEDYVHNKPVEMAAVIAVKLGSLLLGVFSVVAVLKIGVGG